MKCNKMASHKVTPDYHDPAVIYRHTGRPCIDDDRVPNEVACAFRRTFFSLCEFIPGMFYNRGRETLSLHHGYAGGTVMDQILNDLEVRILGCLIEKELTTPEYYPLSLNSLTNACNQKSNRNPVVFCDEPEVSHGLEGLKERGFVRETHTSGSRVPKYLHTLLDRFDFSGHELAILCELMLRGPQTIGELRTRTERMAEFGGLEEVEGTLQGLADHQPPLVLKLARETGRKECRYAHLFAGSVSTERRNDLQTNSVADLSALQERVSRLEAENSEIKGELEALRRSFADFKSQF